MSFQTPITIREAVENINTRRYLLPSIQRELVWSVEQFQRLFDSLMRDYPIGSFLFWEVPKTKLKEYQFYEFLRDYHERDKKHNPKADLLGNEDIVGILDGQQRLTALYIGLRGTFAYKLPRKRWDNDDAFPRRKLYLNLLRGSTDFDFMYDFRFLAKDEAGDEDNRHFWFEVGKILDFNPEHPDELHEYLVERDLGNERFAGKCLFKLNDVINSRGIINFFLEKGDDLDKVLNIFIRVNSGGTELSYSDLLLSIATASWSERDAREEFHSFVDELNNIGDDFNFNKDFVLKACLVLSNFSDIRFKVHNFNAKNMSVVEERWDEITKALRIAVKTAYSFGYNHHTLTSNYAIIPLAHFIQKIGNPENFALSLRYEKDRSLIKHWLARALLKRVFGGQSDTVLRSMRKVIGESSDGFPYRAIKEEFRGKSKSIVLTQDDIDNLLFYRYGKGYTFSVLAMLYPSLNFRHKFHQDHIFPRSFFRSSRELKKRGISDDMHEFYFENCDYVSNLQLLEGIPNEEKSNKDFEDWLDMICEDERARTAYMERHYIPDVDLSFSNFQEFTVERNNLISKRLRELLL